MPVAKKKKETVVKELDKIVMPVIWKTNNSSIAFNDMENNHVVAVAKTLIKRISDYRSHQAENNKMVIDFEQKIKYHQEQINSLISEKQMILERDFKNSEAIKSNQVLLNEANRQMHERNLSLDSQE